MGNREHRWRCAWSLVTLEDGARPLDGVAHPDARWLRVRPELEVLRTIVVPDAVSMVNGFPLEQMPAKQVLRHEYVLEDIRSTDFLRIASKKWNHILVLCLVQPLIRLVFACPSTSLPAPQVSDDADLPQRCLKSQQY